VKVRGEPDEGASWTGDAGEPGVSEPAFWDRIRVHASGRDVPCDVELVAEVENGTYVVSEVRCTRRRGGPEVTGEAIRAVPIHRILTRGAIDANGGLHPGPGVEEIRDQGPTEDSLHVVAYIYRLAHMVGDPPTRAVASAIGVPYSTAARWVQQARQAKFLRPADRGRPGERKRR
jgi:hypothetical protein